jgi:hypothetical protein
VSFCEVSLFVRHDAVAYVDAKLAAFVARW